MNAKHIYNVNGDASRRFAPVAMCIGIGSFAAIAALVAGYAATYSLAAMCAVSGAAYLVLRKLGVELQDHRSAVAYSMLTLPVLALVIVVLV